MPPAARAFAGWSPGRGRRGVGTTCRASVTTAASPRGHGRKDAHLACAHAQVHGLREPRGVSPGRGRDALPPCRVTHRRVGSLGEAVLEQPCDLNIRILFNPSFYFFGGERLYLCWKMLSQTLKRRTCIFRAVGCSVFCSREKHWGTRPIGGSMAA